MYVEVLLSDLLFPREVYCRTVSELWAFLRKASENGRQAIGVWNGKEYAYRDGKRV